MIGDPILAAFNKSKESFAKYFYDMCIEVFGMNLFEKYDWERFFDGGENFFFKQTNQKSVFSNSRYYKRRELIA